MNTDHQNESDPRDQRHPAPEPAREPERPESVEATGTPDAVQAAETTRDSGTEATRRPGRGVEWVRPSDLIARHGATLAGRGIDFQAELARRARAPLAERLHHTGERARRLPPLSAFGRGGTAASGPVRSGVGMS